MSSSFGNPLGFSMGGFKGTASQYPNIIHMRYSVDKEYYHDLEQRCCDKHDALKKLKMRSSEKYYIEIALVQTDLLAYLVSVFFVYAFILPYVLVSALFVSHFSLLGKETPMRG